MVEIPDNDQDTSDEDISAFLVAEKYPVYLRKPSRGQLAIFISMMGADPGDDIQELINNFSAVEVVMHSLAVDPGEVDDEDAVSMRELKRMMARDEISLEDYLGVATGLMQRYAEADEIERNRAERRAATRRPEPRAVARPGRVRR